MSKMVDTTTGRRVYATREEHIDRMRDAEARLIRGQHSTVAERELSAAHGIGNRQARRYIHAVRRIYAHRAADAGLSVEEMLRTLLVAADAAIAGAEPDHKARIKALELYARMRGWLDRKSTVTVQGSVTVEHMPALAGASDEEIAALQAFHDARARRLAIEQPAEFQRLAARDRDASPLPSLGELSDAGVAPDPARSAVPFAGAADGEP